MIETAPRPYPPVIGDAKAATDTAALLFLHIPKAAGLTLQHVLNRQYGLDRVVISPHIDWDDPAAYRRYLEGGDLPGKGAPGFDPNEPVTRKLEELGTEAVSEVAVVMGHFWFGLHEVLGRPCEYFTIVRDPVERVISAFYFYGERFGLRMTLEEYVESARDFEIDNAQTRRLCGRLEDADVRFVECTPEMLELAKRNLRERFAVVGIAERFDESFLLMARTFGWRYPTYDVHNVNRRRPRGRDIPERVRMRLVELNRFDHELYAYATELFNGQLAAVSPPVDARSLRRFRRINFFHQLPRNHPWIGPPLVAGARAVGKALKPVRRAMETASSKA